MTGKTGLVVLSLLACGVRPAVAAVSCSVNETPIQFGSFSGTAIQITGTLTVNCTSGANYQVGIDAGTGGGGVTNRRMTGPGGALLGYQLFRDSAHSLNWGNSPGTDTVAGTGSGTNQLLNLYAQLPANEYAPTGAYNDTTVTVSVTVSGAVLATHNFNVKANILKACNIAATALNFGAYAKVLINATSTISVTCTNNTTYNVGLDAGTAALATVTNRSMTGPGGFLLAYKLFNDSGYTTNWGNSAGNGLVSGTGSGLVKSLTVFGQIPAGQNVAPGSYADTITATLTY